MGKVMNHIEKLHRLFVIGDIKNTEKEPDVDEWYRFLEALPEPKDCYEAVYNKYCCRNLHYSASKKKVLDLAAYAPLKAAMRYVSKTEKTLPELSGNTLLIEIRKDIDYREVLPKELPKKYTALKTTEIAEVDYNDLTVEAKALFMELRRRYSREYYLQLFVLRKLAIHSRYLKEFNPAATAVFVYERNVATPLIRKLYEDSGRRFISFMHGEYLLQIIQAYMGFSEYYVWDKMYIPMFRDDLRCQIGEYFVTTPLKLTKKWKLEEIEPTVFCTYYFSGESTASIQRISELFRKLKAEGKDVRVRPHPRYSHLKLISQSFDPEMIEDPHTVSMEESLARTRYVVGLHTTVLSEAQVEGRTAVIDDIGDPEQFKNLKKRKFVVLEREHRLLSEII